MNQFGPELIFKRRDLFADGRLPNSTFLRHGGEAPFFNDPDEHLHCIKFVHSCLRIPLRNGFYGTKKRFFCSLPRNTSKSLRILVRNSWYSPECQIYVQ